jgi:hypothetical protein
VPQHQSPLLRLPGELRNRIYEYTYSKESEDLCIVNNHRYDYIPRYADAQEKVHGLLQLNSVGHACRQLRSETAGVRRRINRVNSYDTPLDQIKNYGVARIVWFDRNHELHTRDIMNCLRYCMQYSQTEIFFLTERPSLKHGIFALLAQGAAYQMYLRGQALPVHLDEDISQKVLEMTQAMRRSSFDFDREGAQAPSNFHLYPIFEIAEAELKYSLSQVTWRQLRSGAPDISWSMWNGFNDWVPLILRWSEHGI